MSAELLLSKLDAVKQTGPGRWFARCPAHDDRRASLSVRELDDGRVLLHDFAQCPTVEVLSAVGLTLSDLFPERLADHAKSERRPFPAADVLRALDFEALVVLTAAGNIRRGVTLTDTDFDRLATACARIAAAREVAGL